MDSLNIGPLMKLSMLLLALLFSAALAAAQGKDTTVTPAKSDTTVARADYLKLVVDEHARLGKLIEQAQTERTMLEGQILFLQTLKNDSLMLPIR